MERKGLEWKGALITPAVPLCGRCFDAACATQSRVGDEQRLVLSSTWKGRDCVATLAAKASTFAVAASYAHRSLCRRSCSCASTAQYPQVYNV